MLFRSFIILNVESLLIPTGKDGLQLDKLRFNFFMFDSLALLAGLFYLLYRRIIIQFNYFTILYLSLYILKR